MGKNKGNTTERRAKRPRKCKMADKADRHRLYEEAVQCAEAEIDFVDETFQQLRGRKARLLREDFCGTANVACEWVRRRRRNRAIGVDIDAEVQDWGRRHHVAKLGTAKSRITLVNDDVLSAKTERADIVLAMNFSYWLFKDRNMLGEYFRRARRSLVPDGILFMDAMGGHQAFREMRERTKYDDFTYIWEQADYDPITGDYVCHIHFKFPDGSRIRRAFTYEWRLWTLPEIREVLDEAGFSRVTVYWQGEDEETGEGDNVFVPAERGDADPAWIAYLSAEK